MTTYADVASLYLERGFLPIPVRHKRPVPAGATGRNGTVTPEKVADWAANGFRYLANPQTQEWAIQSPLTANTALRAGKLEARIDVDAYGDKNGDLQLAELERRLGPLPGTPSSTARGADSPSRQYFFALPEYIELAGQAADDIEIVQYRHRYSLVWPSVNPDAGNAPYLWYDAEGALMDGPPSHDDLELLPQAWIDHFRIDARESGHSDQQWDGEIPDAASATEERKLRAIVAMLQELPEQWTPGSGWHDTVIRAGCWLARIARSNAYALTFEAARGLLFQHTPIDETQGGIADLETQWRSAMHQTERQFEPPPEPELPPLLPWSGFPMDWPLPTVDGRHFALIWSHRPENHLLAQHRRGMLDGLLAFGLDAASAATLVWHSEAAKRSGGGVSFGGVTYADPHAREITLEELWAEVAAAQLALANPTPDVAAASVIVPPAPPTVPPRSRLIFLDDQERAYVASLQWFGARFMSWAQATFESVNMPYFRMNLWTVLSVIFAIKGVLPKKGGNDRPLNLYQAIVGLTTSGKTEALRVVRHILRAYFLLEESPDVGGNFTPESLTEMLIERDNKSTWFRLDEAHTKIAVWKKPIGPYSEMPGVLTAVYDGEVDAVHRATKKEMPKTGARSCMTVHFMGTPHGMADVMDPSDWESGFLNRFVWAIGDAPKLSIGAMAGGFLVEDELEEDSKAVASGRTMYQQFAAEFSNAVQRISTSNGKPVRLAIPLAVYERHLRFIGELHAVGAGSVYSERLRPTFQRLGETTMRCAGLVALSAGRKRIEVADLLIAIEQVEEWASNILTMVAATDESIRTRQVNALEAAVIEAGGAMHAMAIHRLPRFQNRRRDVLDFIDELIAQGRAAWQDTTKTMLIVRGATHG